MESILDELYYAVLAKGGKPFACQDEEVNKEEVQAEEELKKVLSPEQWSGFVTFLDRYAERRDAEMKMRIDAVLGRDLFWLWRAFAK